MRKNMRALALIGLIVMSGSSARAGALEDCYSRTGAMDGVGECLTRHFDASKLRMQETYDRMMEIALALDDAQRRGQYVPELSSQQRRFEEAAETDCEQRKRVTGSGQNAEYFKIACLIEAYNTRGAALEDHFRLR